jgi:hypothetical protein
MPVLQMSGHGDLGGTQNRLIRVPKDGYAVPERPKVEALAYLEAKNQILTPWVSFVGPTRYGRWDAEDGEPVGGSVCEVVGWGGDERLRGQAEGAADGSGSGIAGGEDVYVGVSDHDGFGGSDGAAADCGGFCDEGFEAVGIGLFGVEAIAAVVLEEERR